jgi:hypothetical protein
MTRSPGPQPSTTATRTAGGTLGTALLGLAGALVLVVVLWLGSFVARGIFSSSTLIFGLGLTVLLAAPLAWAGWYLRGRGQVEALEASTYAERRAVLDQDAALRRELVRDLTQRLAQVERAAPELPGSAAAEVRRAGRVLADVRDDLARPGYSATTWLESGAGLNAEQLATVRRYDDLVSAQVRRIGEIDLSTETGAGRLAEAADLLAEHAREREALFGRGRDAPGLRPQELLAAGAAPRRRLESPLTLALEDAVSYAGSDYLVRAVLGYFGGGRRWRAYQLHDGKQERWLEVRADGAELLWLERVDPPAAMAGDTVTFQGQAYALIERGSAAVSIESAAGKQDGILVDYRRLRAAGDWLLLEDWPDGPRALAGETVHAEDLDLWTRPPAAE